MTNTEFELLYHNKEFYNKFKSVCNDFFLSNRDELMAVAIFDVEDLEQEALLEVSQEEYGKEISYYIKAIQNQMLDIVRKATRREEIAQFEEIDSNLAYGAYSEEGIT